MYLWRMSGERLNNDRRIVIPDRDARETLKVVREFFCDPCSLNLAERRVPERAGVRNDLTGGGAVRKEIPRVSHIGIALYAIEDFIAADDLEVKIEVVIVLRRDPDERKIAGSVGLLVSKEPQLVARRGLNVAVFTQLGKVPRDPSTPAYVCSTVSDEWIARAVVNEFNCR